MKYYCEQLVSYPVSKLFMCPFDVFFLITSIMHQRHRGQHAVSRSSTANSTEHKERYRPKLECTPSCSVQPFTEHICVLQLLDVTIILPRISSRDDPFKKGNRKIPHELSSSCFPPAVSGNEISIPTMNETYLKWLQLQYQHDNITTCVQSQSGVLHN